MSTSEQGAKSAFEEWALAYYEAAEKRRKMVEAMEWLVERQDCGVIHGSEYGKWWFEEASRAFDDCDTPWEAILAAKKAAGG